LTGPELGQRLMQRHSLRLLSEVMPERWQGSSQRPTEHGWSPLSMLVERFWLS